MKKLLVILAVDDEESILKLLRVNLPLDGFDVITASNEVSALELLEEYQPDLVLLDGSGLDGDGFKALVRIRQRWDVPVIMLNNDYDSASLVRALAMSADDYTTKPIDREELAACVRAKL